MSNWDKLKKKIGTSDKPKGNEVDKGKGNGDLKGKKRTVGEAGFDRSGGERHKNNKITDPKSLADNDAVVSHLASRSARLPAHIRDQYRGLDCEMVGIGPTGKKSVLARCCVTNFEGDVLFDSYVRPQDFVTDFRTEWSGVRRKNLRNAISLSECQTEVAALLRDKILVGHALQNDLKVLLLSHPHTHIRDTARYKPYMRPHGRKGGKFKPRALRDLTRQHLKKTIQEGEHDPVSNSKLAVNLLCYQQEFSVPMYLYFTDVER